MNIPDDTPKTSPAVRKMLSDNGLDASQVPASGDRLKKEDVQKFLDEGGSVAETPAPEAVKAKPAPAKEQGDREERVKMSKLRHLLLFIQT